MTAARSEQGRRLLDEALRLLDLAQATRPTSSPKDQDAPLASDCRFCPVCRGIAYLREVDPEAVERLTGAVAELAGAVRDLVGSASTATTGPGGGGADEAACPRAAPVVPRVSVQRIDVTD